MERRELVGGKKLQQEKQKLPHTVFWHRHGTGSASGRMSRRQDLRPYEPQARQAVCILAMPPNLRCLVLRQLAASRPVAVAAPISSIRPFSSTTASPARQRLSIRSTSRPQTTQTNKPKEKQSEKPKERQPEKPKPKQQEKPKERRSEKPKAKQPEKPRVRQPENPKPKQQEKPKEKQPEKPKDTQAEKPKETPKKVKKTGPVEKAPSSFSFLPPPSNDPNQRALPAPAPTANSLFAATHIFTCQKPYFMYAAPRFLNFPVNTHVPEVCILGRSNVGKSTLINALSGAAGAAAGRAHGLEARRAGRAITSAHAGSTKTMNAYGFGPPPKVAPPKKEAEPEAGDEGGKIKSRSEKREEKNKFSKERKPTNQLILVDMPGYGFNSQAEWGKEITKYLEKRRMLKGAVVLIDSVAGVKKDDRAVLGMLRDAGVRTTVVLTKADKIESMEEYRQGQGKEREKGSIGDMCVKVWEELRKIEEESLTWVEGKGWERELWVTGAGDPRNAGLGIAGARLAIAKMAGLVRDERALEDEEAPELGSVVNKPAPTVSKIIPFDQIVWATPHQGTAGSKGGREKASF
ncbi:hypothetical protein B0H65DRAFT_558941 [Neurospora tetraspora]|uniref:EngB-type G domain-containing protein n=1 Tax=Neurospora tetraspora TaxID=94610 RepID=A0AAE0JE23_9PEZI|nr:hypothetical protein B0H65DRAFT_558941 [Neurospora tetraspora]